MKKKFCENNDYSDYTQKRVKKLWKTFASQWLLSLPEARNRSSYYNVVTFLSRSRGKSSYTNDYHPDYNIYGPDYNIYGPDYSDYNPDYNNYDPDYSDYNPDYNDYNPDYNDYDPDYRL